MGFDDGMTSSITEQIILAEKQQHKNTRHDAVDKILEVRAKYEKGYSFPPAVESMFNEMCGAIMNLKQRK